MKIRFTNPFLLAVGAAFILGATFFTNNIYSFFFGGLCFGLIFFNIYEKNK